MLERLVKLSLGMPYAAQLHGLRLLQAVQDHGSGSAEEADVQVALERVADEANPRIAALFAALTHDGSDRVMTAALQRVALVSQDAYGRFKAQPQPNGIHLGHEVISAVCWRRLLAANVDRACNVETKGHTSRFYSFGERELFHYVLVKGLLNGELSIDETASAQRQAPVNAVAG